MESFFTDMGDGDRVVAIVAMYSIDMIPEGRPDVSLSLPINDIGHREGAEVLEEYIRAINCALSLAHCRLRLEKVFDVDGGEITFKGEPSFEALLQHEEGRVRPPLDGPLAPNKFVFVFERATFEKL
ncbi:MAG: hypothetical protein AAB608_02610 [Patescibacteria group bacterium]